MYFQYIEKLKQKYQKPGEVVIVCSNYAWTVFNFRLELLRRLKLEGYRVIVLTQFDGYEDLLKNEVDEVRPLFISRRGINPIFDFFTFVNIFWVCLLNNANTILLFTVKPVIYGCLVCKFLRCRSVAMITGLGTAFITSSWITLLLERLYKFALNGSDRVFFQNPDDRDLFIDRGLVKRAITQITPGSGVDLEKFGYSKAVITDEVCFLLIARMIWDKGVAEFVEAARVIKKAYPYTKFQLLGPANIENRTAIPLQKLSEWVSSGYLEYLGETDNVEPYIRSAHCVVLPSYREGTPKSLLEAAAVGRPIITTDVPGCREVVTHNINGFLCQPKSSSSLVKQMEKFLALSAPEKQRLGIEGRKLVEKYYSQEVVCDLYLSTLLKFRKAPDGLMSSSDQGLSK